jgi:hypothetical protein
MAIVVVVSVLVAAALFILLARYSQHPAKARADVDERLAGESDVKPRIAASRLRFFVDQLLHKMGLHTSSAETLEREGATRLLCSGEGPVGPIDYVVYIESLPVGDTVDASVLLQLAEDVRASNAAAGMLITPYRIDRSGFGGVETPLEQVDGARLAQLVDQHLPELAAELAEYKIEGGATMFTPQGAIAATKARRHSSGMSGQQPAS